jgi:glycosyltransferase involved in cell wall biosynthesis
MRLLVAHPSADVYGSDLQLVETVNGVLARGWCVTVVLPGTGPLGPLLEDAGAQVVVLRFPVLRKALLRPRGLILLLATLPLFLVRAWRLCRQQRPNRLLVNTVTIPWWVLVGRLARVPVVCHVHEAEEDQPRVIRTALAVPLLLSRRVVANSRASLGVLRDAVPAIERRTVVVHNGVATAGASRDARQRRAGDPVRLVLVGRLSPRKGTDVALDAVARLVADGHAVRLRLCGSVFPGYEWYEQQLRARAAEPDLSGRIEFLGYVRDPRVEVDRADVVLVPSRSEPFGNTAVEALLARRPLVASRVQGLAEIVRDRQTGLLVPPCDAAALAEAIKCLIGDPQLAVRLASEGERDAARRFSVDRYRSRIAAEVLES